MIRTISFVAALFLLIGSVYAQEFRDEEVVALRDKIQVINLLNGLFLSEEQLKFVAEEAKELKEAKAELTDQAKQHTAEYKKSLRELEPILMNYTGEVPQDAARNYHRISTKLEKIRHDYDKKAADIINEVKSELTANQLYAVETYKPCIIPPKGQERIGQAESNEHFIKHLEKVRKLTAEQYSKLRYNLAQQIVERVKERAPRGFKFDAEKAKGSIISVFDEARSLSDVDFEIKKEFLAASLRYDLLPKPQNKNVDLMIEKFLLSPQIIEIAKDKLKNGS